MIKNRRGEGYIQTCVLIVTICMILSAFISFVSTVQVVRLVERNTKTVLESHVAKNATTIYNAVKQGGNSAGDINASGFLRGMISFCTLERIGESYYHKDADGQVDYYLSDLTVRYAEDGKLKLCADYTLYVPIVFNSVRVGTACIPTTVRIDFSERF